MHFLTPSHFFTQENARYVERTGTEIFSEMYDRFPTPDLIGNFEDYDDNEDEEDEDED